MTNNERIWQHIENIWKVLKSMDNNIKTKEDIAFIDTSLRHFEELKKNVTPKNNKEKSR